MKRKMFAILAIVAILISSLVYATSSYDKMHNSKPNNINIKFWKSDGMQERVAKIKDKIDKELDLRGEVCPHCNSGSISIINTQEGVEEFDRSEDCVHKPAGSDHYYKTPIYKSYRCNKCGQGFNATHYRERMECHGV